MYFLYKILHPGIIVVVVTHAIKGFMNKRTKISTFSITFPTYIRFTFSNFVSFEKYETLIVKCPSDFLVGEPLI